jgi:hypothetical protein
MERQAVRGLAPNIEHFYVACGPRRVHPSVRGDGQRLLTAIPAHDAAPLRNLPTEDDRGSLAATV